MPLGAKEFCNLPGSQSGAGLRVIAECIEAESAWGVTRGRVLNADSEVRDVHDRPGTGREADLNIAKNLRQVLQLVAGNRSIETRGARLGGHHFATSQ